MGENVPVSRDSILNGARELGLDTSDSHIDELYDYVVTVLSGLDDLMAIEVADSEPDMPFVPRQK